MKNARGISLISLIITIIVLVLISAITIYNGGNALEQGRIKSANERLSIVANAIAAHEEELGFSDIVVGSISGDYKLIGIEEFEIMGLSDYKNDEQLPPIYVFKSGDSVDTNKRVYKLKTPKVVNSKSEYKEEDFIHLTYTFYEDYNRTNLKIEFDSVKGVNRPLITEDMMPVRTYFNEEDVLYSEPVKDIYTEDWYDYSSFSPNWANVKMNDNIYYVWIPRFAYKIEDFYTSTDFSNIPASAIKTVFLKGTTDYMANEEVLPVGYQVHPAFKYVDASGAEVNLPGFWITKYNINNLVNVVYKVAGEGDSVLGAIEEVELEKIHGSKESITSQLESHLLKNTEWAAVAYLSFATTGKTNNGYSLENNPSSVMDLNIKQFVAAGLEDEISNSVIEYFDLYTLKTGDVLSYNTLEERPYGDAISATSLGDSENSAWFGGTSVKISSESPFIIRGVDNCIFSYSSCSRNPDRGAGCRNALIVRTK